MNRNPQPKLRGHSVSSRVGVVLVVILVIVMLMSVAAYGFLLSMQTENMAAHSSGDQLITQQYAFSGIELISAFLELPEQQRQELGSSREQGQLLDIPLDLETAADARKMTSRCLIVQPLSPGISEEAEIPLGMVNESAKLHLMTLVAIDQIQPQAGRTALMRLPGMTGPDADAILDWVDADAQPRAEGAEADVYGQLPTPYLPRNGKPLDLEELLLVRGIDPLRLFGKENVAQSDRAGSRPAVSNSSESLIPWSQFLTVSSAERNVASDGTPRIFLNIPQLDQLHRRLLERLPPDWANFIVLYRQFPTGSGSSQSVSASQMAPNFSAAPQRTIDSLLDLINVSLAVPNNNMTVTVVSPFTNDPSQLQTQLPRLFDRLTVSPEARIVGRIQLNLAPREVLLAIPGLDPSVPEKILAARGMDRAVTPGRNCPAWPFTEGIVDLPTMRKMLPWITTGGDVIRAEFWGLQDAQTPMSRYEAVIDASLRPARTVSLREREPISRAQLAAWIYEAK